MKQSGLHSFALQMKGRFMYNTIRVETDGDNLIRDNCHDRVT